jgi:hypothetical protein
LFSNRHRRRPFAGLGQVALSRALASFRAISFCLTASHASPRARLPVFSRLTPGNLGGKLRYACDPWSVLARPEPPGRLHSSTGSPHEHLEGSISRWFAVASALSGLLRGLFSSRSTSLGNRHWAWTYNGSVSASRHPGLTYEPLDVIVFLSTSRDSDSQVWSQPLRHSG